MSRVVQWPAWKLSVGDFVKSRWFMRVFVVRLDGVNHDACLGNSNCVARVSRSKVTSQILPRFPLLACCVIWRGFFSRKQIFAAPEKQ